MAMLYLNLCYKNVHYKGTTWSLITAGRLADSDMGG